MRKALSIFLTALLIILPVEQVLAQTVQQDAVSVQQTRPPNPAAALLRVPPLSENSVRLLRGSSERSLLNTPFAEAPLVQESAGDGLGTWEMVGVVLGLVVVAGGILGGIEAAGENDDPESFKSSHDVFYGVGYGALVAIPYAVIGGAILLACALTPCER